MIKAIFLSIEPNKLKTILHVIVRIKYNGKDTSNLA